MSWRLFVAIAFAQHPTQAEYEKGRNCRQKNYI